MSADNALHVLIKKGLIREALDLINSGTWLEERDGQEQTSLILAVKGGYVDLVKALILKGADLNKKDKYGRTALHYAALSRSEEISGMLIKAGANPLLKDKQRKIASQHITKGTALYDLLKKAEKERRKILKTKAKELENKRKSISGKSKDLNTELARAIGKRDIESILKLINMGADINTHALNGHTALHVALEKGKGAIAQRLVDRGASTLAADNSGNTPLMLAQKKGITIITPQSNVSVPNKISQPKHPEVSSIIKAPKTPIIKQTNIEAKKPVLKQTTNIDVKDKVPVGPRQQHVEVSVKDTSTVHQSQSYSKGSVNHKQDLPKPTGDMKIAIQSALKITLVSGIEKASHAKPLIPNATPSAGVRSSNIIKKL
jgi:ankyrin repeat protein